MKFRLLILILLPAVLQVVSAAATEFPGRERPEYKNLKTIDIGELHSDLQENRIIVVDVRSKLEFDTIHIRNAVHDAVADKGFADNLKDIISRASAKKIAFY